MYYWLLETFWNEWQSKVGAGETSDFSRLERWSQRLFAEWLDAREQVASVGRPDVDALYGIWVKSKTYEGWLRDGLGRVIHSPDYRLMWAELATAIAQNYWETCSIGRIDEWAFEQQKKMEKGEAWQNGHFMT